MAAEQALSKETISGARGEDRVMRLSGARLALARLVWVWFALLAATVFVAAIPARYNQLLRIAGQHHAILARFGFADAALALYVSALDVGTFLACCLTALVIFWRRSDERMAIYVSLMLVLYGTWVTRTPEALAAAPSWLYLPVDLVLAMIQILSILFLFLFPNGEWTPRWTRLLAGVWMLLVILWHIFPSLPFNPTYLTSAPASLVMFLAWLFTGMVAQVYRYIRVSSPTQRQQTKWVLFGVLGTIVGGSAFLTLPMAWPMWREPGLARLVYIVAGVPLLYLANLLLPLSIGMSVLRYRLWEIDPIVNRTLVYGALTGMLALIYFGSVVVLQQLFRTLTGQGQSEVVTVISTLAIAALFQPLRNYIQTWIDRRFYRRRYDATQTLAAFSATLRDEVDLDRLADRLVAVVEDTVQPAHVFLWLKPEPTADDLVQQARDKMPASQRRSDASQRDR